MCSIFYISNLSSPGNLWSKQHNSNLKQEKKPYCYAAPLLTFTIYVSFCLISRFSNQTDKYANSCNFNGQHFKKQRRKIPNPFYSLTFHPHNLAVKFFIPNNLEFLQNDSETGTIFSQPPLIPFKRDKNRQLLGQKLVAN